MRIIKKYPNRRLYDTEDSKYITLEDISVLVTENKEFVVIDSKTESDLTRNILLQIIIEKEQLVAVCEYIIRNLYDKNIPELLTEFDFDPDFDEEYRSNDLTIEILAQSEQFQLYFRNQEDEGISNQILIRILK